MPTEDGRIGLSDLLHFRWEVVLGNEIIDGIWRAVTYRPDGILNANDIAADICSPYAPEDAVYPWQGLNQLTRGMRKGEIVTWCAGSGIGKSQILIQ